MFREAIAKGDTVEQAFANACRELGVDPARVYIRYGWTPSFGWNGANF